jgi:molybdopterin synthase sulfur carrier subunit
LAVVRIPTPLRPLAEGAREVELPAETVGQLLQALDARFPGFRERLCERDGALRPFINVYVGRDDVRLRDGLDTALAPDDVISIVPAMSGGR